MAKLIAKQSKTQSIGLSYHQNGRHTTTYT